MRYVLDASLKGIGTARQCTGLSSSSVSLCSRAAVSRRTCLSLKDNGVPLTALRTAESADQSLLDLATNIVH